MVDVFECHYVSKGPSSWKKSIINYLRNSRAIGVALIVLSTPLIVFALLLFALHDLAVMLDV